MKSIIVSYLLKSAGVGTVGRRGRNGFSLPPHHGRVCDWHIKLQNAMNAILESILGHVRICLLGSLQGTIINPHFCLTILTKTYIVTLLNKMHM